MKLTTCLVVQHGITQSQAAILAALHEAGSWIDRDRLNAMTASASQLYDSAGPVRGINTVSVHINALRKHFGEEVILSTWGRGYTLGAIGVLVCRRALTAKVAA